MRYYAVTRANNTDELYHYGVKGMKWGVRRANYYGNGKSKFKASNGLTVGAPKNRRVEAFRKVQGTKVGSSALNGMAKANTAFYGRGKNKAKWKRFEEQVRKENQAVRESNQAHKTAKKEQRQADKDLKKAARNTPEAKAARKAKMVKAAKVGAVVAGTALAAYGGYKLSQAVKNKAYAETISRGEKIARENLNKNLNVGVSTFKDGTFRVTQNGQTVSSGKVKGVLNNKTANEIHNFYKNSARNGYDNDMRNFTNEAVNNSKTLRNAVRYLYSNRRN